ncbi:MAG: N-6 DNA methylase [Polyangiales bacterium]
MATTRRSVGGPPLPLPLLCALVAARELDRREADAEAMAAFEGAEFLPGIPEGVRWRDWCDLRGDELLRVFFERVLSALRQLPDTGNAVRLKRLAPVFAGVAARIEVLEYVVRAVAAMDLETVDGQAQVARDLAHRIKSRPEDQVESGLFAPMAASLMGLARGARVLDPWVQDGSRLLDLNARTEGLRIAGVAVSPDAYAITLARLLVAGVRDFSLEVGDVFRTPPPSNRSNGFDAIVAMPPVGVRLDEGTIGRLPVPAASSELAALEYVALGLRGGGKAAMLLPSPSLARGGRDARVRRWLLEEYRVDGVVEMGMHGYGTELTFEMVLFSRELPRAEVRFLSIWDVGVAEAERLQTNEPWNGGMEGVLRDGLFGEDRRQIHRSVRVEHLLSRDANLLQPLRARWQEKESAWQAILAKLEVHASECPVVPLGEIADVFGGTTPDRDNLRAEPGEGRGPYVRIRDISDGTIRPPSRWVEPRGVEGVPRERRLRPGDIVLTARGNDYRAAVVANGAVGAIAGSGIRVLRLRRDDVTTGYLHAWLASPSVSARLLTLQTGAVVANLRNEALASLEVAVPSLAIQARVARAWRDRAEDAVEEVLRALGGKGEPDTWLQTFTEHEALRALIDGRTDQALERVMSALQAVPPAEETGERTPSADFAWRLRELLPVLSNLRDVRDGALRCAGLLAARLKVRDEVEPHYEATGEELFLKLNPIARALDRLLAVEVDSLLRGAHLSTELSTPTSAARIVSATLWLRNAGTIALRQIELRVREGCAWATEGVAAADLIEQGGAMPIELHWGGDADVAPPIEVSWSALRVDGRRVTGEASFPITEVFVGSSNDVRRIGDLGPNPYVVGDPARDDMFFGREDVLLTIEGQLAAAGRSSVILLEGARRSGKTSIQFRLMRRAKVVDVVMVRSDLQRIEGDARGMLSAERLWRGLAADVAARVVEEGYNVVVPGTAAPPAHLHPDMAVPFIVRGWFREGEPFERWEVYLDAVLRALAPRRLVLILDEFDRLAESIDAGALSIAALGQLRALLQRRTDLCVVLTGTRAMTRLRNERSSPLFGMGFNVPVGPLPLDDARALVTRPVARRLDWTGAARDRVVEVCGRQPFMIQSLCAWIFKDAALHDQRRVDGAAVDRAIDAFSQDHGHFQTLWKDVETSRRRMVLALCADAMADGESRALDAAVLEQKLTAAGVLVPDDGIGDDLEALRRDALLELHSRDGYQRYRLTLPLFGEWIRRNQDRSVLARHTNDDALEGEEA